MNTDGEFQQVDPWDQPRTARGTIADTRQEADCIVRELLNGWAHFLRLSGGQLVPPMLSGPWIAGLRAAGVHADLARVWQNGRKYPTKLPFVIEFPCPYWHRTEDERDIASVRLMILDDGWARLDTDSACPRCTPEAVERWLLTCPRCEEGLEDRTHRPGHDPRHSRGQVVTNGPVVVMGDTSPYSYVLEVFSRLRDDAEAMMWMRAPDMARRWLEAEGWKADLIDYAMRAAGRRQAVEAASAPGWTAEGARAWLDALRDDEGGTIVTSAASQAHAWALVKDLPGRPPKRFVEEAQTRRKRASASDEATLLTPPHHPTTRTTS